MTKVLLIGFDGASFDKIKFLVGKGELPTFAKFMKDGCSGTMQTTIPPVSAAAWTSLATGVNPGKHGIFYFITPDGHVVLSDKIAGKTVWDVLSISGKKVILLNMSMTYPPYAVNGIMVSGFPCPSNNLSVYPPNLTTRLNDAVPGYQVGPSYLKSNFEGMEKDKFYKELLSVTKKRLDMALHLMSKYPWDFFAVVFTSLDRVQHVFWGDQPDYVSQYYKLLDTTLNLLNHTNDAVTFVVSDHGFEAFNRKFGINDWLREQGFLKLATRAASKKRTFSLLFSLRQMLPLKVRRIIPLNLRKKTRFTRIDFSETLAYSPYGGAIISSSPHKKRIKKLLYELDFIDKVFEKEEVYTGDHLKEAPDLLLALKEGYVSVPWAKGVVEVMKKPRKNRSWKSGVHQGLLAQIAVFMAKGKPIKRGHVVNPNIIDIAPTILKLMNIKIPSTMEGKVLDIFT